MEVDLIAIPVAVLEMLLSTTEVAHAIWRLMMAYVVVSGRYRAYFGHRLTPDANP